MKINKHICFGIDKAPELAEYLRTNGISYKCSGTFLTVDILTNNPHWPIVENIVALKRLTCISETIFSKKELLESKWLCVRSKWNYGYPQPESGFEYQGITYCSETLCNSCGCGGVQKAPFRIKASPKWGTRHFMMLNWINDELFCDSHAKEVLQRNGISGLKFIEVQNKNGSAVLPDIYQLFVEEKCRDGFLPFNTAIQNTYICPFCGQVKYHPSGVGQYVFRMSALDGMPDICKSSESFGWGAVSSNLVLIRQAVYRILIENNLDRSLVFSPIELI